MVLLQIGELEIQLHRKAIKNLHLSVLPPEGCVRVSAPLTMTDTAIRMAVISRIPWIKKQRSDHQPISTICERNGKWRVPLCLGAKI